MHLDNPTYPLCMEILISTSLFLNVFSHISPAFMSPGICEEGDVQLFPFFSTCFGFKCEWMRLVSQTESQLSQQLATQVVCLVAL